MLIVWKNVESTNQQTALKHEPSHKIDRYSMIPLSTLAIKEPIIVIHNICLISVYAKANGLTLSYRSTFVHCMFRLNFAYPVTFATDNKGRITSSNGL